MEAPDLDWFRDLYRRVGEEWLWFSRLRMSDAELAAIIHAPRVEVYALVHDGGDEGLLELDFREAGQCELVYFGVTEKLIGSGAGRFLMNQHWNGRGRDRYHASGSTPAASITRTRSHIISVSAFARSGGRSKWLMIHGSTGRCRAKQQNMCRDCSSNVEYTCSRPSSPATGSARAPPDDRLRRAIRYTRGGCDQFETPRRTGYSAFAEYNGLTRFAP